MDFIHLKITRLWSQQVRIIPVSLFLTYIRHKPNSFFFFFLKPFKALNVLWLGFQTRQHVPLGHMSSYGN